MTSVSRSVGPGPVTFTTADVTLRGDRWQGGDKGLVLLLHGGGQTRRSWGASAQSLSDDGWGVTTLDLRGHGESDWSPDGGYDIHRFAEDLHHVVSEMLEPPVVVGASLGGLASLAMEAQYALSRALVLVDVVPRPASEGQQRIMDFMGSHVGGFDSLAAVAAAVAEYKGQPVRETSGLRRSVRQREDGRWYWHWDPRFLQMGPDAPGAIDPEALFAGAARLTVPVLMVRGGESDVVDIAGVDEFLRRVPDARVREVAGAGHMVAGDDNDQFLDVLTDFLDGLAGKPE